MLPAHRRVARLRPIGLILLLILVLVALLWLTVGCAGNGSGEEGEKEQEQASKRVLRSSWVGGQVTPEEATLQEDEEEET